METNAIVCVLIVILILIAVMQFISVWLPGSWSGGAGQGEEYKWLHGDDDDDTSPVGASAASPAGAEDYETSPDGEITHLGLPACLDLEYTMFQVSTDADETLSTWNAANVNKLREVFIPEKTWTRYTYRARNFEELYSKKYQTFFNEATQFGHCMDFAIYKWCHDAYYKELEQHALQTKMRWPIVDALITDLDDNLALPTLLANHYFVGTLYFDYPVIDSDLTFTNERRNDELQRIMELIPWSASSVTGEIIDYSINKMLISSVPNVPELTEQIRGQFLYKYEEVEAIVTTPPHMDIPLPAEEVMSEDLNTMTSAQFINNILLEIPNYVHMTDIGCPGTDYGWGILQFKSCRIWLTAFLDYLLYESDSHLHIDFVSEILNLMDKYHGEGLWDANITAKAFEYAQDTRGVTDRSVTDFLGHDDRNRIPQQLIMLLYITGHISESLPNIIPALSGLITTLMLAFSRITVELQGQIPENTLIVFLMTKMRDSLCMCEDNGKILAREIPPNRNQCWDAISCVHIDTIIKMRNAVLTMGMNTIYDPFMYDVQPAPSADGHGKREHRMGKDLCIGGNIALGTGHVKLGMNPCITYNPKLDPALYNTLRTIEHAGVNTIKITVRPVPAFRPGRPTRAPIPIPPMPRMLLTEPVQQSITQQTDMSLMSLNELLCFDVRDGNTNDRAKLIYYISRRYTDNREHFTRCRGGWLGKKRRKARKWYEKHQDLGV